MSAEDSETNKLLPPAKSFRDDSSPLQPMSSSTKGPTDLGTSFEDDYHGEQGTIGHSADPQSSATVLVHDNRRVEGCDVFERKDTDLLHTLHRSQCTINYPILPRDPRTITKVIITFHSFNYASH